MNKNKNKQMNKLNRYKKFFLYFLNNDVKYVRVKIREGEKIIIYICVLKRRPAKQKLQKQFKRDAKKTMCCLFYTLRVASSILLIINNKKYCYL